MRGSIAPDPVLLLGAQVIAEYERLSHEAASRHPQPMHT
jgi:hypothetical protein